MRELLEKQAALLRGVASRIESSRRARARRLEQLQALWREAELLRSPAAKGPETLARLQTLCAELEGGAPAGTQSLLSDAETLGR